MRDKDQVYPPHVANDPHKLEQIKFYLDSTKETEVKTGEKEKVKEVKK